ncbi:hypothetical protein BDI4_730038 [Burkholderia diffusa]|nr:hypothetical protein BDI4_730038 [Burkholderia diffusa]
MHRPLDVGDLMRADPTEGRVDPSRRAVRTNTRAAGGVNARRRAAAREWPYNRRTS